jgi:hypothetical protein
MTLWTTLPRVPKPSVELLERTAAPLAGPPEDDAGPKHALKPSRNPTAEAAGTASRACADPRLTDRECERTSHGAP